MYLKTQLNHRMRYLLLSLFCATVGIWTTSAAVNYYECADKGYINATYTSRSGVIATSNKGSDINLLKDGQLVPLVQSPGAGMYINISHDGKYVGFKSINNNADQAPALLDVESGRIILLENHVDQCGQVSFAEDGTMAYTLGNTLVVRNGDSKRRYNLGQYVNIANISPDGQWVAYTDLDGIIHLLNLNSGKTESIDGNGAYRAVWSPDNSKLAVQQVNGGLLTMERATKAVHNLGEASSVTWAGNSEEVVITRSHRVNELEVKGAEVLHMRYDGSAATTIVPLSESTPVAASMDGNDIIISYATGRDRGVHRMKYAANSRKAAPASVSALAAFGDNKTVGDYVATDFKGFKRIDYNSLSDSEREAIVAREENERKKASTGIQKANDIGLTAIPYINQVWDTPAVGGNYNYGYVCCAPSSSCMLLGWLGYLSPHPVTSRSSYAAVKTCQYSWYVSQQYTSPKTGYTFSTSTNAGGYWGYSYGVKGGHGYMWGNGSPASMMASFHTRNGIANSYFSSSWSVLVNQCNANRPYIICLANGTGGHVVIVFRANQQAANDGSSTWAKTGSFICHDPYGDYNGSSYPNWDGRYATYDWPGYSNGKKNIGSFYWGCVSEFTSGGGTPATNPTITVSPTDAKFNCMLNETPSLTFTVTGKDLSSDISVASSHSWRFPVSVSSLSKTGGTFTITMAHSEIAGTYGQGGTALDGTFYVRLKSGNTEKTINITADVTAPPLEGLTEKWVYSQQRGNASSHGYDMSKIRNFAYNDGKLYCVYDKSKILVLNAQTGQSLGFLSNGDVVKGGAVALADVKVIDNVVVASNIAIAANGNDLRLYAWENDNARPYLLLSTTDFQGAPRLGDCLEMTGSFANDCWFAFANDANGETKIVEYNRKDGQWLAKHTKVYTSAGKQYPCGATVRAYPKGGGWWIDGKNSQAAWTTWDDGIQGAVVRTNCKTDFDRGSSHHEFYWKGLKYAVNVNFADINGNNAKMRIIHDKTGDFSSTAMIGAYPSDGLGAVANTDGTADCMVNTDGQTYLEAWVLSTNQGIGYFSVGTPPTHNPDPITPPVTETTLATDRDELDFSCYVKEEISQKVTVTATNLKTSISARIEGADASQFAVSPSSLQSSGDVSVTYRPTVAGSASATLILSADGAEARVRLNGTAQQRDDDFVFEITADKLNEVWISSTNAGAKEWHTPATARSIAYNDGKLYVLHCKAWAAPAITILNAYTAEKIADLNCSGITGATIQIGDIAFLDGKLVACNVCTAAQNFRIYRWDNDNAAPQVILSRDGNGVNGKIGGGAMSLSGNWESGRIWLPTQGSNSLVYFNIANGAIDPTPREITLTDENGNNLANGDDGRGTARVVVNPDGSFWLASHHSAPARFSADGKRIEMMNPAALGHNYRGTAFNYFAFGSKSYATAITYDHNDATVNSYNGKMALIDVTDGITAATEPVTTVPSNSLGGALNDQRITTLCQSTRNDGTTLDLWASVNNQGIAHYSYNGRETTGVANLDANADLLDMETEYYTIHGIRVSGDNLAPGIYIRRQGTAVSKILIK